MKRLILILLVAGTVQAQQPDYTTKLSYTDRLGAQIYQLPQIASCDKRGWPQTATCMGAALATAKQIGEWERDYLKQQISMTSNPELGGSSISTGLVGPPCPYKQVGTTSMTYLDVEGCADRDNPKQDITFPCTHSQPCGETPAPKLEKPPAVNPADSITGCAGAGCLTTLSLPYEEPPHEMLDIREGYATASIGMDGPALKDGRKVYTITALPAWTCAPTTGTGNAVTIVCLKSEPSADEHKGGKP